MLNQGKAGDKNNSFIQSKHGWKIIARTHNHCVLQTSRYLVDIPSLSSQSECTKIDIHWFGIY